MTLCILLLQIIHVIERFEVLVLKESFIECLICRLNILVNRWFKTFFRIDWKFYFNISVCFTLAIGLLFLTCDCFVVISFERFFRIEFFIEFLLAESRRLFLNISYKIGIYSICIELNYAFFEIFHSASC